MFERFTERARMVVVLAQEEARSLRHNYIGTEHILLGLLREEEGVAAQVLQRLGIDLETVRSKVVVIVGSGEETASGQIPFTPRAKRVLELALREALGLGHDYIGTEHLLLGLVRENDGVAIGILIDLGTDAENVRREVIAALSRPRGSSSTPAEWTAPVAYIHHEDPPRPALDWNRASILWRPEGLELRIPLHLDRGAVAALAADAAWAGPPLAGLRREIWDGWLALASPSLLDQLDPAELRGVLDDAAQRAQVNGSSDGRVEDFLRRLREAG